mmetsp:Transcript_65236/g.103374  ORF Transcript_65236/g.103374 Transcript_65236/m.103374 type:complete len:109 (-) Transcript_65236:1069-1395(-)
MGNGWCLKAFRQFLLEDHLQLSPSLVHVAVVPGNHLEVHSGSWMSCKVSEQAFTDQGTPRPEIWHFEDKALVDHGIKDGRHTGLIFLSRKHRTLRVIIIVDKLEADSR